MWILVMMARLLMVTPPLAGQRFSEQCARDYNIFNPANRYAPDNPFNPANRYHPANPLNPANRYNPNTPFAPLNRSR